jgi:putative hydrolase of the HAD superfamily
MMVVSTVLFVDLDGTICVNPFRTAVFPHIHALLSPETMLSGDQFIQIAVQEFLNRIAASDGHDPRVVDWDEIVIQVGRNLGLELNVSVRELVERNAHPPYISILDDADVALRQLRQEPHRRLVVSSMGLAKFQMPVLEGLGLSVLFHDFLMPDLTGHLKNMPEFYARYADQVGDSLLISIGDTYKDDVLMPKSFGFQSIMKVPLPALQALDPLERPAALLDYRAQIPSLPENPPVLPDAVITHISELPYTVERLEALRRLEKQPA